MNNMRILNTISLAASLLFILGCQPNSTTDTTDTINTNDTTIVIDPTPIQPSHLSNCYYHLTGTLGELKVVAELIQSEDESSATGKALKGFYLYEKYGGPIALYGRIDKNGTVELIEQGNWNGEPHKIVGQWDVSGSFTGEWINSNRKDRYPVVLTSSSNEFIKIECHQAQDSILAFPDEALSPQATFSAHWFEARSDSKTLNAFLNKAITQELKSDGSNTYSNTDNDFILAQKESFFSDYMTEINASVEDGTIDTTGTDNEFYGLSHALDLAMEVYYNSSELITLGYTHYSYMGGVHGIYGTSVSSYDLRAMKKITLDDVFKPGYEKKLSELLDQAIRSKFELKEDAPLSEILFDDSIMPNNNFGVTEKGIFFVYSPYEIAPYAAGEIELFVTFEKILDFIKE